MAISDILNNFNEVTKYKHSSHKIDVYLFFKQRSSSIAILAANRFHMKVLCRDLSFTESEL
ncbi:MAG: hypothetical protein ACTMUB_05875 [cyanobacterium endosymbiont of Rhopalodia musculus]|uniref:hypothetical protein n=1 Tax=cyanobacterium endosymbiont of Epithemia clementina EcSB TaxID=3034674 RepID=UPI0024814DBA|nr:hypothetical protein [cyanobacterium endosymbiont of Epithemia clementina EcSB]WGT67665.1 hypothetical protein P3F56_00735 [cyanobacterium endosymbiont of Epithemia clementina EcSB]